jgi:probable rRNA maturation factor
MHFFAWNVPRNMSSSSKKDVSRKKRSAANASRIAVRTTIRRSWNTADFVSIAQAILGPRYDLSIVLIGDTKARKLNITYRNKHTPANVLSFPLSKTEGEIFLNMARATRESPQYGLTPAQHVRFLLIHGCLHLRGYDHGSTMEEAEQTFLKRFVLR